MPNNNDHKIIERLTNDSALEMNRNELEKLLDTELSKAAEEIDAQLVAELLNVLQPEEIPTETQQKIWQNVVEQLQPKPRKTHRLLKRFAAVAACVVLLFGMSLGAAHAFRWTFLIKLLQPVAETFGIYKNYSDDQVSDAVPENVYAISEDENTTVLHYELSELPDTYNGYTIKPSWLPEGYTFAYASSFVESNLQKYAYSYMRGEEELSIAISFYFDSDLTASFFYERTEETSERIIHGQLVTFYQNADDQIQSVSWVNGNIHYSIFGNATVEEIEKIIEGFGKSEAE